MPDFDFAAVRPTAMAAVEARRVADGNVASRMQDQRDVLTMFDDLRLNARSHGLHIAVEDVAEHAPHG